MANFDLSKYDTVADRIKQFRADYPKGAILTRIVPELSTFNEVVCEAEIWLDLNDPRPVARDLAAEWKGENFRAGANFTAWHENAATSAIGRALDAAGYSKNKQPGTRATQDEMGKADRVGSNRPAQSANTETATNTAPSEIISLKKEFVVLATSLGHEWPETENGKEDRRHFVSILCGKNVSALSELTLDDWRKVVSELRKQQPRDMEGAA